MLYKRFVFLFVMMPFFVMAQSSTKWSLFLNGTQLLSSSVDSAASVQLSQHNKGNIKIAFEKRDAGFKRTLLFMNKMRQTFLQKEMSTTGKNASFSIAGVLAKSNKKPFVIYMVDVPADASKAIGVRVAPVAICNVDWKE